MFDVLVCADKVAMLDTVREHVLRLEDKQQELKEKLLKMTASLEAAREEHKVTVVAVAAAAAAALVVFDAVTYRSHIHGYVCVVNDHGNFLLSATPVPYNASREHAVHAAAPCVWERDKAMLGRYCSRNFAFYRTPKHVCVEWAPQSVASAKGSRPSFYDVFGAVVLQLAVADAHGGQLILNGPYNNTANTLIFSIVKSDTLHGIFSESIASLNGAP